jgi:hypothetical protein
LPVHHDAVVSHEDDDIPIDKMVAHIDLWHLSQTQAWLTRASGRATTRQFALTAYRIRPNGLTYRSRQVRERAQLLMKRILVRAWICNGT